MPKLMSSIIRLRISDYLSNTVHTREAVDNLFRAIDLNEVSAIYLNFEGIDFISRSFADELVKHMSLLKKEHYEVELLNLSDEINQMLNKVGESNTTRTFAEFQFIDLLDEKSLEQFLLQTS